ncbi:hypothetical protein [Lonsdalea quercina]|uniref:hypothetical protein n=1 Tax=Lonsdalea quercina TaxID=71657 RepID=UPI003F475995
MLLLTVAPNLVRQRRVLSERQRNAVMLRHETDDVDIYLFDVAAMTAVSKRIPGAFEHIGIWLLGLMKIFIVKQ